MVRLSQESEQRDVLNVLAADRRELVLKLRTQQPLRKPQNPKQRKAVQRLRAEASRQIVAQLDSAARQAFRGRVAVELRLRVPDASSTPGLETMVKDYVDMLVGSLVIDDSRVDHLIVLRETSCAELAEATVRCLPLSVFAAEYDRAFRVLGHRGAIATVTRDRREVAAAPFLNGTLNPNYRWGLSHFDSFEIRKLRQDEGIIELLNQLDDDEEQQLAEDPDALVDLDIPASYPEFVDSDTRDRARAYLEESIALSRGDWLTDQGFDARDRPGPAPSWLDETVARDLADVIGLPDAGPGCFVVPAPPERTTPRGELSWQRRVAQTIETQALRGWRHQARFRGPVVADVALRGAAGRRNDVDNVAHEVLRAIRRAFHPGIPPLMGYRVYRRDWPTDDVRVRLMPKIRLEALCAAMDEARRVVRAERNERARE